MNWAVIIKRIRNDLLITQVELSKVIGVSFASINRWERGIHEPTMAAKRKIKDLCSEHNITMED